MVNQIQSATVNPVMYSQNQVYANNQQTAMVPAYRQDTYAASTQPKRGVAGDIWNGIKTGLNKIKTGIVHTVQHAKEFFATPTGKIVGLALTVGLGAALIFTPILPMTFTAVGGAISGLGHGLVSAGTAIAHASFGAAAGSTAVGTAITASPFVAGFLGGVTGAVIGGWLKDKVCGKPNNCQPNPCPSHS